MAIVEFFEEDNKVTLRGRRYRAERGEIGTCNGCVMKKGLGCVLAEAVYGTKGYATDKGPRCGAKQRKDGRSVIWVLDV